MSNNNTFGIAYKYHKIGLNTGLNVRDIHLQSGVDYDYLRSRLRKWHEWGYLNRKPVDTGKGRPVYAYTIARRGEHFIEDIVPRDILNQYIAEIRAFKANEVKQGVKL